MYLQIVTYHSIFIHRQLIENFSFFHGIRATILGARLRSALLLKFNGLCSPILSLSDRRPSLLALHVFLPRLHDLHYRKSNWAPLSSIWPETHTVRRRSLVFRHHRQPLLPLTWSLVTCGSFAHCSPRTSKHESPFNNSSKGQSNMHRLVNMLATFKVRICHSS